MREISYNRAAMEAIAEEMRRDATTFHLATDAPPSLLEEFGAERVRASPIAESTLTGMAIGGKPLKILVPQAECEVIDNWHVVGLAGTGSKDIKMNGVFIPDHRTIGFRERGPRFNDAGLFRLPQWSVYPYSLVGVLIGVAQAQQETAVGDRQRSS